MAERGEYRHGNKIYENTVQDSNEAGVFRVVDGKVANRDLQVLFNISAQAVHKELTKLVGLKVIKQRGQGRSLHYIVV